MNRKVKTVLLSLLALFFLIQLIRPVRHHGGQVSENDIAGIYPVPEKVQAILKKSCYDCHSNRTVYPWYSELQPLRWWMDNHVNEGKEQLNFSEFGKYSERKRQSKLKSIAGRVADETMPLKSYTMIHRNSGLSPADKALLAEWLKTCCNSF